MKAWQWIDLVKEARGWPTDYRTAKELGISRRTISNYRCYLDRTMDEETSVRVAAALRERPELVVLDQLHERTSSDLVRLAIAGALERMRAGDPPATRTRETRGRSPRRTAAAQVPLLLG